MRHSPRIRSLVCQGIAFRMELNFSINAVFDGEHESEHFILVFSDLFFLCLFDIFVLMRDDPHIYGLGLSMPDAMFLCSDVKQQLD